MLPMNVRSSQSVFLMVIEIERLTIMQRKTLKKWWCKYILLILIIIICCLLYKKWKDDNDFIKTHFQVIDKYTTQYFTREELENKYAQPNFLTDLIDFNNEIVNNSKYKFIQFQANPIELIGHWDKPLSLANGYEHKDLTNQTVEYEGKQIEITPVNAIQLGKESQIPTLNKKVFQDTDFEQKDDIVPLFLGYDFKDYYKIGDKIEFIYLYKTWTGVVTGFLDKNTKINMDDFGVWNLDNFMVMPFFDQLSDKSDFVSYYDKGFRIHYYLAKNNGYVILENKEEYKSAKRYIEKLAKEYNLDFTVLRGY